MKLYIGAAYNGQDELAARENPDAPLLIGFHKTVLQLVESGADVTAYARALIEKSPDMVISGDEIGAGVVPLTERDRAWREAYGRAMCVLAQNSERVTRVVCGIGNVIKG